MIDKYFGIQDADLRFFKRFLENRLPNRVVDGGVHVCLPEHLPAEALKLFAGSRMSEEYLKEYVSNVFPNIKYEYIALPVSGKAIDITENNRYISGLRTRSIIAISPDFDIEYYERIMLTAGFSGFYLNCNNIKKNKDNKLSLFNGFSHEQLNLVDRYEKAVYVHFSEKQQLSDENVREFKNIRQLYPNLKIVISGFWGCSDTEQLQDGFKKFGSDLNDYYFDTAAVLDSRVFDSAFDSINHEKIIYSSGMPYSFWDGSLDCNLSRKGRDYENHCTSFVYEQLKGLLDAIGDDEEVKRKIFIENAEKVYTLTQGQDSVGGRRVILKDVAKASGYSLRTVKKVMGGKEYVSDNVKKKVLSVGKELGYKKNKIASALAKNQTYKIAVVYTETSKYFFPEVRKGFENCIKDYQDFGIEVEFFIGKEANSDLPAIQSNLLKELNLRNDIKGVVIHPFNSEKLTHEINELEDAGKAVVTFVTDAPDSKRMCYVGSGGRKSGRIAAQLMGNYLGRKGRVGILNTVSSHWQSVNREEGFINKMHESFPDIELVEHNFQKLLTDEEYYNYVRNILKEGSIEGVFATSANVYLIGKLLKETGNKNTTVIGFDLSEETRQLLKDGFIDVIIFQNPELQAYESLKILCDYILEDVKPKNRSIYTDVSIITGESL